MFSRRRASLVVLTGIAVLLGGCSSGKKPEAAPRHSGSVTYQYIPFDQIDPQVISDGEPIAGQNLLEGMVTPDAPGTGVAPATADSWTVSQDGTVYTFHIRDDARWSDGTPVTAQDFEWSYRRLLKPSTRTAESLNASSRYRTGIGIKNAVNYQTGKVTDWSLVGVKALDHAHLRITLESPNTSFLEEMADPSMVALPRANLEKYPFAWQEAAHWVGNGPFVIQSWVPNSTMVLVPNPNYWDRNDVHLSRVTIRTTATTDAQNASGYKHNDLDIAEVSDPSMFERDQAFASVLTRLDESVVLFLTVIPSRNPTLRDARVREAIALAIGRNEVAKVSDTAKPATALVPDKLPGFDAAVGFEENVARARQLFAAAGYPGGKGFPKFSIMTTGDDPYIRATVRTLHDNLGINAVQDVEDPNLENVKRAEVQPPSFIGYFSTGYGEIETWRDWVYKYPPTQTEALSLSPDDYTRYKALQAKGTGSALSAAQNFLTSHASAVSRQFAATAAAADRTTNPDEATALYKRAAALRQQTFEFIPIAYSARVFIVRPDIKGVRLWAGYPVISFKGVTVR